MPAPALALSIALQLLAAAPPAQSARPDRLSRPAAPRIRAPAEQLQREQRADEIDVSGYPPEQRAQYGLFRRKCGKCHSSSLAVGSRYTVGQARRHAKRPGVAISDADLRSIVAFLEFDRARRASREATAGEGAALPSSRGGAAP